MDGFWHLLILVISGEVASSMDGDEKYRRGELRLLEMDAEFRALGDEYGFVYETGMREVPSRAFVRLGPLNRKVQVFLDGDEFEYVRVWICAWRDEGGVRFWKGCFVSSGVAWQEFREAFRGTLQIAFGKVKGLSGKDLERSA